MSYNPKYQKKYRSKTGYSEIARRSQIVRQRRNTIILVRFLLKHPCKRCGETDILVLEFHHRNPSTKKHSVSFLCLNGDATKTLKREMRKCDVLCANCHKREHASVIRKRILKEVLSGNVVEYKRVRTLG